MSIIQVHSDTVQAGDEFMTPDGLPYRVISIDPHYTPGRSGERRHAVCLWMDTLVSFNTTFLKGWFNNRKDS